MNAAYIREYFLLLNELDDLLSDDPMPESPEGLRAQELVDQLMILDKETAVLEGYRLEPSKQETAQKLLRNFVKGL